MMSNGTRLDHRAQHYHVQGVALSLKRSVVACICHALFAGISGAGYAEETIILAGIKPRGVECCAN
jgi:hypothetical protein